MFLTSYHSPTYVNSKDSLVYPQARVDEQLFLYEAFLIQPGVGRDTDHCKLRFRKVHHGLILKERTVRGVGATKKNETKGGRTPVWLRPFDDISGYAGVSS